MGLGLENPIHLLLVLVVVLLLFGAKRAPEIGRSLGSGIRGFKDSLTGSEPGQPRELP
jgi:sec-independent protein translocase protein TatA